jgi:hypothetical protein
MSPVDVVLDRLAGYRVRPNGTDRWRACCPAHSGSNPSALSVGVGREGQVLLRCWAGCEVDAIASSLGLELEDLFPPRDSSVGRPAKRRLLPAAQALELIDQEMTLCVICASNMAAGNPLDESARERLRRAAARVGMLREEVRS